MKRYLLTPFIAVALSTTGMLFAEPISPVPADPLTTENALPLTKEEDAALDGKFLDKATRCNLAEIKFSQEVDGRVKRDDIKQFAKMMIADHKDVNKNLTNLADKMKIKLPSELLTDAQVTLDKLKAAADVHIDKMYIDVMVQDHTKAVSLFEERAKNSQNADIKAFAERTLPGLRTHLAKAIELQKSFGTTVGANPAAL
jgi:putative membrane protein